MNNEELEVLYKTFEENSKTLKFNFIDMIKHYINGKRLELIFKKYQY